MVAIQQKVKNIVVAEDDDDDYFIFKVALEESNIEVALTRAENGDALIALLDQQVPELLFLDLKLPRKSGRECLQEIRGNRRYDELPIIICSSFTDESTIEYCFKEGANRYCFKPSSISVFSLTLKRILLTNSNDLFYRSRSEFIVDPIFSRPTAFMCKIEPSMSIAGRF